MNKKLLLLSLISVFYSLHANYWQQMQREYEAVDRTFRSQLSHLTSEYLHPYWQQERQNMARIIRGKEDTRFLHRGPVAGPMVRKVWCSTQDYEVVCLKNCIKKETAELLKLFKDTTFGGVSLECKQFNCSINALGQLFFLAKIIERNPVTLLQTIVELGGGYGCLARVINQVLPLTTYIGLDLPEYLAIQSYYLRSTIAGVQVKVHEKLPEQFEKGVIHLVPIYFIDQLALNADIFISTAALSETSEVVQKKVLQKRFFNAKSTYLTGQLNRWGPQHNFEPHQFLLDGMREIYELCFCQPLHHFGGNLNCYEIYGTNQPAAHE